MVNIRKKFKNILSLKGLMLGFSVAVGIFSFSTLMVGLVLLIIKQHSISSTAFYYFTIAIISLIGWVLGDMLQVYFNQINRVEAIRAASQFATISSMVAMIAIILFTRVLTSRRTLDSIIVFIAVAIFGGVVGLTLSSSYQVNPSPVGTSDIIFYITETNLLWLILNAGLVLFAGVFFLAYLIRQRSFVGDKSKKSLNTMMIGVIIAFFVSISIYATRKIYLAYTSKIIILHLELVSVAIGALIISFSIVTGGTQAFYYSSEITGLYIFDNDGVVLHSCVSKGRLNVDGSSIPGIAVAFAIFIKDLIGKDVYPKEVDLGQHSLMLETQKNIICLLVCKHPTAQLRQGLQNILNNFNVLLTNDEIASIIEKYLAFTPSSSS